MANFIEQIELGEELYDLHDSEFIIDNRTASGAALTGVSKAPALFDGMQITYWLNYAAASNATMNLTLADGTKTGAIPVYYSGTTRLTTHYAAGNVLHMTYRENAVISGTARGEGWWCDANYYSDSNYDIFGTAMDVDTAIYNYSLFAITGHNGTIAKQTNTNEAGTYWKANSFTQSGGNGTSKKATTKGYYPYKIFYNPNNTSYTTAGGNTSTVASGTSNLDLRYTVNGTTSANIGATGAPFFLVGTIGSDGLFYLKGDQATKEWWTAGIPTTKNTDYVYWFVGMMSSAYQVRLSDRNWFLKWTGTGDDDHLIQFEPWFTVEHADSADSVPWSGVTGKPNTFTPASHTHGYIGNDGSIAPSVSASPASGDKILISDLTDSNKVKGGPEIGSNDGKFLRHDGVWEKPTGMIVSVSQSEDPPAFVNPDISYGDILDAYKSGVPVTFIDSQGVFVMTVLGAREETAVVGTGSAYYWTVQFAGVPQAHGGAVFVLEGGYAQTSPSLQGSAFYFVETPVGFASVDMPVQSVPSSGDYILRSNGAEAHWEAAPEGALIVEFNTVVQQYVVAETSFTELSNALTSGRSVYIKFNVSGAVTTGLIEILSSRYVPSSESSASYDMYACSVIFPAGTPNLFSGDPLKHETQATIPIGDAGDGEHIATMTLMIAYGMAGIFSVYGGRNTVTVNKSEVELTNGLLSLSVSDDMYAIQAPSHDSTDRYDFIAYVSD